MLCVQLLGADQKRIISQTEGGLMRAPKPCVGCGGGGHPPACMHMTSSKGIEGCYKSGGKEMKQFGAAAFRNTV
jgi:hypothetical protein